MIRMHYRSDLPFLACVAQEEDRIVVALHNYVQTAMSNAERQSLFNRLMREIEHGGTDITVRGAGGRDVVVQLADRRERRAVYRTLAEGLAVPF